MPTGVALRDPRQQLFDAAARVLIRGGVTALTSRAVTQARKFNAKLATPYRAIALEPGDGVHTARLEEDHAVVARAVLLATGAQYRRLPPEAQHSHLLHAAPRESALHPAR